MRGEQPTPIFRTEEDLSRLAASERIRYRLIGAQCRFHANDNISAFIEEGEIDELRAEVESKMQEVLRALVIDTDSDHNTADTAKRVAKMFLTEVFRGRYVPMPAVTEFPNAERLNELMIVGPIKVRSACSHHLCPIMGRLWIGLMPNEHSNLIGLSKYARICEWIMSRPQIQEEAVTMLANELQTRVKPDGLAIVMEADHFCMHWRGVKDDESMMTNSVMRGAFLKDANLRREFLSLLSKDRNSRRRWGSFRKAPRITLLVIMDSSSLTPRQCMQKWSASITIAKPSGFTRSCNSLASIVTASSWICGRLMIQSQMREYFDRPIRFECSFGMMPIQTLPMIGHRWCEQALRTLIGPTIINSFRRSALGNSVTAGIGTYRPLNTSVRNILATRLAVSAVLWSLSVSITSARSTSAILASTSLRNSSISPSLM